MNTVKTQFSEQIFWGIQGFEIMRVKKSKETVKENSNTLQCICMEFEILMPKIMKFNWTLQKCLWMLKRFSLFKEQK